MTNMYFYIGTRQANSALDTDAVRLLRSKTTGPLAGLSQSQSAVAAAGRVRRRIQPVTGTRYRNRRQSNEAALIEVPSTRGGKPMEDGLIAIDVMWKHDSDTEPVRLVSVLNQNRYEICKLEFFRDGRVGFSDEKRPALGTQLGLLPVPALSEINADPQFVARETTMEAFETLWSRHVT